MANFKTKLNLVFFIWGYLSISAALSFPANEIKIRGIVTDSATGEPIPYVNIQVLNTNWGTTTNKEGRFQLVLRMESCSLKITHIGYISYVVNVHDSINNLTIKLKPAPIEFEPVEVYAGKNDYSWEEYFISKAIEKKNEFLDKLSHYSAFAYSKTSISSADSSEDLYAYIESISEINFISPDFYQEKLLDIKMPRLLKNYPYGDIGIKLNVDLNHNEVKLQKTSLISPLNDNALDYYKFMLKGKGMQDSDTIITLYLQPKTDQKPLFEGDLIFSKDSHYLVEANLQGNRASFDGLVEKIEFFQRYNLKNGFNVPVFSKIKLRLNFSGLHLWITQENTLINYLFNNEVQEPYISLDKKVIFEPDIRYAVDKNREEMFHVPLTEEEKEANEKIDSLYTDSPFFLKAFLYLITDFPPLVFDRPAVIAGININKISNWYHFDKVSGHFLGAEYQLLNHNDLNLYGHVGYAFNQKLFEYYFRFRYRQFILDGERQIINLGRFPYNKIYTSLNSLFTHEDIFNYFKTQRYGLTITQNIGTRWNFSGSINIENQISLSNSTEFSLFSRSRSYPANYEIGDYRNNGIGFQIDYVENNNYMGNNLVVYKGGSFLNASLSYKYTGKFLNATENRSTLDLRIHRLQPVAGPVSVYLFASLHMQDKTDYIQNMNFLNQFEPLMVEENDLTFFTVKNYDYYAGNYFKIKGVFNIYDFPNGSTAGLLFSFLRQLTHSYNFESIKTFKELDKNLIEYGIFVKGLSYFNLYILLNNLDVKKPMFEIYFYY